MVTSALQTEGDNWRDDGIASKSQVASLQIALKESNNKLKDVQQQLDNLQRNIKNPKPSRKDFEDKYEERKAAAAQEKLRELEVKFVDFEHQIKQLGQENAKLLKELNVAYSEALSRLRRLVHNFLWGGSDGTRDTRPRVCWRAVILPRQAGNLGIVDPEMQSAALPSKLIVRGLYPGEEPWKQ
ncbi:hypothetical protein L7F22_024319 [Adiantum nelumboides]|nr:hypothetical protein [Adiantum nelumboides]